VVQGVIHGTDKKYSFAGYDDIDYAPDVVATLMVIRAEIRVISRKGVEYKVTDLDFKWVINFLDFLRHVNLEITGRKIKKE
jgi:hypothetical protein